MRQREKDYIRNRKLFMDAAEALFAANGFSQTTVEEIANRAGFSKGSIYNYFDNKEAILIAIIEEKAKLLDSGVRDVLEIKGELEDIMVKMVKFHLDFTKNNSNFFRLAASERYRLNEKLSNEIHTRIIAYYHNHRNLVRDLLKRYAVSLRKDLPLTELAGALMGIISSHTSEYILLPEAPINIDKEASKIVALFLNGAKK